MTEFSEFDKQMLKRAMDLAARGVGQVSPSPLVGCVIVDQGGEVVGEGFYLYDGIRHAETIAIEQARTRAAGGTAYVSLEPHSYQARTPPCTDALIKAGVKRVVAPLEDPNPKVNGKGFDQLRSNGIIVDVGLMNSEAERLNETYLHCVRSGLPFIHLKFACSLDGKIATSSGQSRWITGELAREQVHKLRHKYDAILIGSGTAVSDDPILTDRSGQRRHRPLHRVVLDKRLRLSPNSRLAMSANEAPVTVFGSNEADHDKISGLELRGVKVVKSPDSEAFLNHTLSTLAAEGIQSVLVEGGSKVAGAFLDSNLVNKVTAFIAPILIGGKEAPQAIEGAGLRSLSESFRLKDVYISRHGEDIEVTGYLK